MKKIALLCSFLIIFSQSLWSAVNVDADNANIQYIGRFDHANAKSVSFDWSGVYINAVFTGTSISVRLTDSGNSNYRNANHYSVFIDSQLAKVLVAFSTQTIYPVSTGLADTSHTIMIVKWDEADWGQGTFQGFVLDDSKTLLPPAPRPNRRIEFIGDSYTCGYGNQATDPNAPNTAENENVYDAFGPLITRHFNADYQIVAFSGRGLVRNYGGQYATEHLPDMYERICYANTSRLWDFSWQPDAVVLYLGTNDFSTTPYPTQIAFESGYVAFLATLRQKYPNAHIFCLYCPLTNSVAENYIHNSVTTANDPKISFVSFPLSLDDNLGERGTDGHPSWKGDIKIANALIPYIQVAFSTGSDTNVDTSTPTPTPTPTPETTNILDNVKVGPNPITIESSSMKFTNMPDDTVLNIFSLSGKLICTLSETDSLTNGQISWDGKNTNGEYIAQGIYIYVLKTHDQTKKTGKIVVKRGN